MQVDPARVESIFGEALTKAEGTARAAYLEQACGGDVPLRERVEALLAAHDATANFLKLRDAAAATALSEGPGSKIGHYKLLEQIGEGGFGVVFMAEQTEPVQRKVALKIVKPGMDTRQVIARFEAERQALALMDHPHIAKVLDAGTTDSGRPYFVMELVRGVPINQYCDEHRLAPRQRLELFVSVCQAVQHAHQKGIIHRDLKPTNVLVAEYDERPMAMVIDFGVAKAIGRPLTEKTLFTEFGQVIGTIDYMSPEQAKLNQLDIDTRTDIYSLGVLLYELLAGSTPLDRQRLHSAAFDEMLRIIREEEFPNPSTRLSSSDSLPSIAANRSLEPRKLTGLMRGELDWIVMKALEKDRNRRYETANGLARDIEHYLHDEPVLARPPSAGYRFSKFARRNKAALLTVGLVATALVVGTIVSTWQAIRATRAEGLAETRLETERLARQEADKARTAEADQRKAAEAERAEAEQQRSEAEKQRAIAETNYQKAKAAVDKYFTLVSESKLFEVPGLEELRINLLEAALEFYEGAALERSNDPAVLVDMALTNLKVGPVYLAMNRSDNYVASVRRAVNLIDRLHREHPSATELEQQLAGFWRGLRWTQTRMEAPRDGVGAVQTMLRFEAMWTAFATKYPTNLGFRMDLAYVEAMMGVGMTGSGRIQEGTKYFRKARAIVQELLTQDPTNGQYRENLVTGGMALTRNLNSEKHPDEALEIIRDTARIAEGLTAESPDVPTYAAGLSEALFLLGCQVMKEQPEEAERAFQRARELTRPLIEKFPNHRIFAERWAIAAAASGVVDGVTARDVDIEQAVNEMLDRFEAQLKRQSQSRVLREEFARQCQERAINFLRQGNIALANRLFQHAAEVGAALVEEFPDDREVFERAMANYRSAAGNLWGQNQMDQAARLYQHAVEIIVKRARGLPVSPDDLPVSAWMVSNLARILAWGGRTPDIQETCRLCLRATDVLRETVMKDPMRQAYLAVAMRRFVARFNQEAKSIPEADELLTWSSPIVEQTILDSDVLIKTTTDRNAIMEDRYASSDAQRHLCHFLSSTGRNERAFEISLANLRSFESFANDRADQRFMISHVLVDLRQILGARVDELVKDGHVDDAAKVIRQAIGVIGELTSKYPKSGDGYSVANVELWNRLLQVLSDAGRGAEVLEARRAFAGAVEALLLRTSSPLGFKGELTGITFDWAMTVASLNTDPEGRNLISRSIDILESRIKRNPKDQMVRFRLAALTHRLAERRFAQAIDDNSAEQYQRQALELFRGLAEEILTDTVFLEHVAWSFHNLAEIARSAGKFDEAREHFQTAADTWKKMSADKNVPQRNGWFKNWEADNLVQLAGVLAASSRPADAAEPARRSFDICEALVVAYPYNGEYRSRALVAARIAQSLINASRPQDAVEPSRRQIALFEKQQADFPQENLNNTIGCAYLTLALPLTQIGQLEEGKQAYDKAVQLLENDAATLNYFAWPLASSKDVKPAVAAIAVQAAEQATKAVPHGSSLWNTLGVAQYRAGKWQDAIASLTKSEDIALPKQLAFAGSSKHLAFNGFFLAMAHWQLGHKDEARKWFDRSVEWMEKYQPKNYELIQFRAEAEQLLGITQPNPTAKDVPQEGGAAKRKS